MTTRLRATTGAAFACMALSAACASIVGVDSATFGDGGPTTSSPETGARASSHGSSESTGASSTLASHSGGATTSRATSESSGGTSSSGTSSGDASAASSDGSASTATSSASTGGSDAGHMADATPGHDGLADAPSSHDGASSDAAACVTVTVPGPGTPPACPSPVTNSCAPGKITGFAPVVHAPTGLYQGLCTMGEIQMLYNTCFGAGATMAGCNSFEASEPACYKCIFSNTTDATWGPLVSAANGSTYLNTGGCLELLEPCNSACADTIMAQDECEEAACATNCEASSVMAYNTCATTVDGCDPGGCAQYYDGAQGCEAAITGKQHPAEACGNFSTFQGGVLTLGGIFCGMVP